MKRTCLFLLALVCFPLIGSSSAQLTIHVPADRSTIQSAIDSAVNGDSILVAPGTYHERIDFKGKNISVASEAGAATTIIDGDFSGTVISIRNGVTNAATLKGFTITHGKNRYVAPNYDEAGGIEIYYASPRIEENIIIDNQGCMGLGIDSYGGSPIIRNNTISNNQQTTCSGGAGGGIALSGSDSAEVIGNTITGNVLGENFGSMGGGISIGYSGSPLIQNNIISKNSATTGGGIVMFNNVSPRVIQNLITDNMGGGIDWGATPYSTNPIVLFNNTIANNDRNQSQASALYARGWDSAAIVANNLLIAKNGQPAVYCDIGYDSGLPQMAFNDVFSDGGATFAGSCGDLTGTRSNISVDPQFANPAAGNYHLSTSSPVLDKADGTVASLPTTDLDNFPRLIDGGTGTAKLDLGAYEYQGLTTMEVSPSALQFDSVKVNTSSVAQNVSVKNTGMLPLHFKVAQVGVDFTQTNNCELPNGLAPNATCSYAVSFSPESGGDKSESLVISGANVSGASSVGLSGTGAGPIVTLSTTSLDFGGQMIYNASAARLVSITNIGDAALVVNSITINGDYVQTNNCGVVQPNASCTISVRFTPLATRVRSGIITITDDSTGSPRQVSLTGVGLGAEISFYPSQLNFMSQRIGTTSNPQPVIVVNISTYDLVIGQIGISADYLQTNNCPATLKAGSSCVVTVTFKPMSYGSRPGSLTFTDDAAFSPQSVALSGSGTAPIAVLNPVTVAFSGQYFVGSSSKPVTIYYNNYGNDVLAAQNIAITGDFTQTNECNRILPPQDYCLIRVTFVPTAVGTRTGTLTVTDNADGSPRTVLLQGLGITQYPVPVLNSLSQEAVRAGTSTTLTVTGSNFFPASQVIWDDQPLTTTYQSGTSLTATVTSSLASGVGEHKISVINPAPGGGRSNTITVTLFISVPVSATDLISDAYRKVFYAAISGDAASYSNTIMTLDPNTGNIVGTPLSIGSNPSALALSDDGQYLYVGLKGASSIKRVNLTTNKVDLEISLGNDLYYGPYTVRNLAVVPGSPHSVVASLGFSGIWDEAGVKVFDDGVARPNSISRWESIDSIVFGTDPSILYGATGGVSPSSLEALNLDSSGLTILKEQRESLSSPIFSDGSRLYSYKSVVDTNTFNLLGTFSFVAGGVASVFPERNSNQVYLLEAISDADGKNSRVLAADKSTFVQTGHLLIPVPSDGIGKLQRWGSNGLAYRYVADRWSDSSNDQVVFVRSSIVSPAFPGIQFAPDSVSFGSQQQGTTSAITPVMIRNTGSADLIISNLTLTGADATQFAFTAAAFPITVAPNAATTVNLTFSPATTGAKSAALVITDNADNSPHAMPLSGTGIGSAIEVDPVVLSFNWQSLNVQSSPLAVNIRNIGGGLLTVSSLSTTGANAIDFAVLPIGTPFTVAPGTSQIVKLTFTPSVIGNRTATLTIGHNAGSGVSVVGLNGTGSATSPYPLPVLSTVSQEAVKAGSSTTLTVKGSNFFPGSQVFWDDQPLTTTYQSGTSLTAIVTSSLANGSGEHKISVVNPLPGGGRSSTITVTLFNSVHISATDLVFDRYRNVFYAAVSGFAASYPNTVISLDPNTGNVVGTPLPVGSDPSALAMSDDGQYLYVGLRGASFIKRVNLYTNQVDLSIPLGSDPSFRPYTVRNLAVVPGSPHSVVASLGFSGIWDAAGVKVFDDGVARPKSIDQSAYIDSIVFGNDPSILYGGATGGAPLCSMKLDSSGLAIVKSQSNSAWSPIFADGDRLYSHTMVVDASAFNLLGKFSFAVEGVSSVYPERYNNQVFLLEEGPDDTGRTSRLWAADKLTFVQTAHLLMPVPDDGLGKLLRWGSNGLAFRNFKNSYDTSNDQVVFVRSSVVVPGVAAIQLAPTAVGFGSQPAGTTSTITPVTIKNTGSADLVISDLAITGTDAAQFAFTATALPITVPSNATTTVNLTFLPTASGAKSAALSINDNAGGSPHVVSLSGTGTAPIIELSPTGLAFGWQALNKTSDPVIVNVKNTGTAPLTVTNVAILGTNASDFAIPGTATPFTVAPGETWPISVTFTPSDVGPRTANLKLYHNASNSVSFVGLTGAGVKIATTAQFSPVSIDFGTFPTGTPLTAKYVVVINTGSANLVITEIAITGPGAGDFTLGARPMPVTVSPFSIISIPVTANPTAVGLRTATLKFSDNATGTPHQVALSVTGKGTPAFSAAPATVDFGKQNVGVASASLPVTISNPGTDNLVITALSFAGVNATDFTVTSASGLPITVAPGSTTTLTLKFTPATSGARTATLRVTNNTSGSPNSISITGTGTIPVLITTAPGDFGPAPTSTTSAAKTAVLTNTGTGVLTVSAITIAGTNAGDFAIVAPPTLPTVIQPGAALNLSVTFTPSATGTRTASISINDTAAGSPHSIALSGTGTPNGPAIAFNPPAVAFGNQQMSQIRSVFLTVTNPGNQTLTITNVQVTGANPGDFGIAPTLPANINAGGSTVFEIAFKPTAIGSRSAQLTFTDNVTGGTQSVLLTGTGVSGQITASPSSLVFADQSSGTQSAAKLVTVTNPGTQTASITSLLISGTNASSFSLVNAPALPASIAAGGTLTFNLVFTPTSVASGLSATFTVTSSNAGSATVTLSGNGIQSTGANISLNTTSLAFPATNLNTASTSKPVVLSNTGFVNVMISSVTITGTNPSDFALSGPTAPFAVWPQSSTVVSVTFKPTNSGTRNAILTLVDNAPGSPHTIMLSGIGQ